MYKAPVIVKRTRRAAHFTDIDVYKKLGYRQGTARCVVSIEILPIASNSAETTYTTSPDQIDGMKLEI